MCTHHNNPDAVYKPTVKTDTMDISFTLLRPSSSTHPGARRS